MGRLALLFRLALRNVWRQARRSVLTAAAMVVGLALLMMTRAIADGAHGDWITAGVRLGTGHVALEAPGYVRRGTIVDRLDGATLAAVRHALAAPDVAPLVEQAAPRIQVPGLARSPTSAVPITVVGVDPAVEATFSTLDDHLVRGRYLRSDDRLMAYVGDGLARRLHLTVDDRLVLSSQDTSGVIAEQLVRIAGVFHSGIPEVDNGLVQVPLTTVQRWLGAGDGVSMVAVLLHDGRETTAVATRLAHTLDRAVPNRVAVLPWPKAMPDLDAAVRIDDFSGYVFNGVLLAIVALAIVNTVLMSVLYRTREFGVLEALGLTGRATGGLVFLEGVTLTAVSGLVGIALGLVVTWVFFRHGLDFSAFMKGDLTAGGVVMNPVIVPVFRVAQVLQSLAWIAVIGILAAIYPAYRATRIDIAEAMKFE